MAEPITPASVVSRAVTHPGRIISGIPTFVFVAPAGWLVDEAPGALAVLRLDRKVDDFWVNALLSHDKVAASVTLEQASQITWAKLQKSAQQLVSQGERVMRFDGLSVYVRGCEFSNGERTLAQMHAIWAAPAAEGAKVADLFQLVLTAPVRVMPDCSAAILEMLSTFRFT